ASTLRRSWPAWPAGHEPAGPSRLGPGPARHPGEGDLSKGGPTMILVVGPNLAVDHTVDVPGFQTGHIFRTGRSLTVAGGKGANVARVLHALGMPVHLVGLVAGWAGRFIRESLAEEGIPATVVEVGGLSRTCTLIVDGSAGDATVINEEGNLQITSE